MAILIYEDIFLKYASLEPREMVHLANRNRELDLWFTLPVSLIMGQGFDSFWHSMDKQVKSPGGMGRELINYLWEFAPWSCTYGKVGVGSWGNCKIWGTYLYNEDLNINNVGLKIHIYSHFCSRLNQQYFSEHSEFNVFPRVQRARNVLCGMGNHSIPPLMTLVDTTLCFSLAKLKRIEMLSILQRTTTNLLLIDN